MKWVISKTVETPDGQKQEIRGVYVFWFVADNEQTTGNVQLQCYLVKDLLLAPGCCNAGLIFPVLPFALPGQEDAAFERMEKLIAASVPEYQLPPVNR
jgi:hypothetical protein